MPTKALMLYDDSRPTPAYVFWVVYSPTEMDSRSLNPPTASGPDVASISCEGYAFLRTGWTPLCWILYANEGVDLKYSAKSRRHVWYPATQGSSTVPEISSDTKALPYC